MHTYTYMCCTYVHKYKIFCVCMYMSMHVASYLANYVLFVERSLKKRKSKDPELSIDGMSPANVMCINSP